MTEHQESVSGIILDESTTFSLDELSGACEVQVELIVALVEEGIIEPLESRSVEWQFPATQLPRARKAMHLYHDLELNLAGVALALELLDEVSELRSRLRQLESSF
ncbi:chaperone modulator CbpM [Thiohalophilus thiocyanatoxydans]|uniref:Chaperone modulatory protein CbpM n=1 Tax=Thiohalophilus thiocyanatoxydans TaxID=381308 RepID=A0A4R8IPT7_9GAMM|nr:chaperone modulator CbpM [Thiohalophilus thiocyanatoxydans]TDY02548.1 chaperone modulatory protein CbpM [Thiohalophilus thiocyanatoxydans]